jgi:hypothetical protein
MSLHDDEIQLKRLKLKLAINRYVLKWGKQYANQLYYMLRCDDMDCYQDVLAEMCVSGMLTKTLGRNGGLILLRIAVGNSTNGVFGSEVETEEDAS